MQVRHLCFRFRSSLSSMHEHMSSHGSDRVAFVFGSTCAYNAPKTLVFFCVHGIYKQDPFGAKEFSRLTLTLWCCRWSYFDSNAAVDVNVIVFIKINPPFAAWS